MRHRALQISLSIVAALLIGCSKSDFPTTPSPVADTPLTTVAAMKVEGNASLPGGGQTPFNMTLIARSLDATAPGTRALTPGTTEVNGNFVLGTGVKGTVSGSIQGSLASGTLLGTLTSSADACTRQYNGPISTAGLAWLASDSTGACPLPITVQASRADAPSACTYSISPVGAVPGGGVTTVIDITTGPTCTWVVEAQAPWLRVTPSTGMGPGTVTVVVDPSEVPRQGTVLVAGQSLSIDQTPACAFAVAPQTASFPESGGSSTLTITTQARCDWRAENAPDWLAVSPGGGNGTTTLTLVAQPNSGAERQASLRVGGQPVTITQAGRSGGPAPCIEGVTLGATTFEKSGGTGFIDITASAACAWTAQADVPWIVITGGSGNGPGRISFTVEPNSGSDRTGTVRVGGRVVTITQRGPLPCNYRISVPPTAFPASGGTGTVAVTVEDHCEWVVESMVDWIKVQTGAARGTGSAQFIVAANPTATLRQGELRIAGQSFIVTQAAQPPCNYQITASPNAFPSSGGTGAVTVTVEAHCEWVVQSVVDWIVIATPSSGSGNGRVPYNVLANTGAARTGTITIGGQTLTVTQSAPTVLTGQIANAINNQPVAGATVSVGSLSTVTNGSGTYALANPPSGLQPVQVSAPGFVSRTETVNIVANSTTTFGAALVPLRADITIVLTWGAQPPDLDAHLTGPRTDGGTFEVSFENMQPVPYASLDVDDQDGSGPETVTIARVNGNFVAGGYRFFIDNYSETPGFDVSNAIVAVFQGDTEIGRFPASGAAGQPSSRQWQVFSMILSATPTGQPQITPIQQFTQPATGLVPSLQRRKR